MEPSNNKPHEKYLFKNEEKVVHSVTSTYTIPVNLNYNDIPSITNVKKLDIDSWGDTSNSVAEAGGCLTGPFQAGNSTPVKFSFKSKNRVLLIPKKYRLLIVLFRSPILGGWLSISYQWGYEFLNTFRCLYKPRPKSSL